MNFELSLALLILVSVSAGLWAAAIALRRVERDVTLRGLRNGLLAALVLFLVTATLVTFMFDVSLGILVGAVIGLGYFWLGAILIPIGLLFHARPDWTRVGAWVAVPIIVMSAGFGYAAYRAVQQEGAPPTSTNGTVELSLSGARLGTANASGAATCQFDNTGALRLQAGAGIGGSPLNATDGRPVTIQYAMDANGANRSIQLGVSGVKAVPGQGWDPSPQTIALSPTSTAHAGQVTLSGMVPLDANGEPNPTEVWSGVFNWTCSGS
jgi:hypothetical protein